RAPQIARAVGDFSVVVRNDGVTQIAYKGRALYTFDGDLSPGDANGIGVDKRFQPANVARYFAPVNASVQATRKLGIVWSTAEGKTLYKRQGFILQSGSGHNLRHGDTVRPAVGRDVGTNP